MEERGASSKKRGKKTEKTPKKRDGKGLEYPSGGGREIPRGASKTLASFQAALGNETGLVTTQIARSLGLLRTGRTPFNGGRKGGEGNSITICRIPKLRKRFREGG